jgi:tRNA A37 threonylcarbamoyladenosine dehydratase
MNLEKHLEFFDPILVKESVHIIGLGAIGSHIAELLARLGIENFHIYDYDKVEDKNVANQMYFIKQEGDFKVHAVEDVIRGINPDAKIETYINGWNKHVLSGYVFICVDSIAARKQIVEDNMYNDYVKAMFDFRMRLSDAQHYAADWKNQ